MIHRVGILLNELWSRRTLGRTSSIHFSLIHVVCAAMLINENVGFFLLKDKLREQELTYSKIDSTLFPVSLIWRLRIYKSSFMLIPYALSLGNHKTGDALVALQYNTFHK